MDLTVLQPVKRVEIVVNTLQLGRVLEAVRRCGADSYSVIHEVEGRGRRGEQRADEVSGASSNVYILIVIDAERALAIAQAAKPLLQTYGGICLISDGQWLEH